MANTYKIGANTVIDGNLSLTTDDLRASRIEHRFYTTPETALNARLDWGFDLGGIKHFGPFTASHQTGDVDKFPFASDQDAVARANDLTITNAWRAAARSIGMGMSWVSGGMQVSPNAVRLTTIEGMRLISDQAGSSIGNLAANTSGHTGHQSETHGFAAGGHSGGDFNTPGEVSVTHIQKFPFTFTSVTATDVGDVSVGFIVALGLSSSTHGYRGGGRSAGPAGVTTDDMTKFPFASGGTSTFVGNMTTSSQGEYGGASSSTDGHFVWTVSSATVTSIDKFPFSSDVNATSVGSVATGVDAFATCDSSTHGYTVGGAPTTPATSPGPATAVFTIQKFSFAGLGAAADIADLVGQHATGHFAMGA